MWRTSSVTQLPSLWSCLAEKRIKRDVMSMYSAARVKLNKIPSSMKWDAWNGPTNKLVRFLETKKKGRNIISEKVRRKLQFKHQPSQTQHWLIYVLTIKPIVLNQVTLLKLDKSIYLSSSDELSSSIIYVLYLSFHWNKKSPTMETKTSARS